MFGPRLAGLRSSSGGLGCGVHGDQGMDVILVLTVLNGRREVRRADQRLRSGEAFQVAGPSATPWCIEILGRAKRQQAGMAHANGRREIEQEGVPGFGR